MAPALLPGDELYVDPDYRKYRRGDVAVFFSGGKFYSHRILLTFRLGKTIHLLEMGDANHLGRFISSGKVLGRVLQVRREDKVSFLTDLDEEKAAKRQARKSLVRLLGRGSVNYMKQRIKKWLS
jgi:hypothetical protein